MNKLAIFDFDRTITTRDTFLDFLYYSFGFWRFFIGIFCLSPYFLLSRFCLISNLKIKTKLWSYFMRGVNLKDYQKMAKNYSTKRLPKYIRKKAFECIQKHKKRGENLVVVSASFEDWIKPWAVDNGFEAILASSFEIKEKKITGKILRNCHGKTKVDELQKLYPNVEDIYVVAYGDSKGDLPLLNFANEAYYRKF